MMFLNAFLRSFDFLLTNEHERMIASLLLLIGTCLALAKGDYVAAVAEHTVFMGSESDTSDYKLQKNLEIYSNLTTLAKTKGVQIIVFPEFGLTPSGAKVRSDLYPFGEKIPDVKDSSPAIPCVEPSFKDKPILSTMSCAAKTHQMSILVNMIDWVDCTQATDSNCPSDNHYQYNTDVVFNEKGALVAKYHKSHEFTPFIGVYDQYPIITEVTYKSSFGVEFGIFICYDIVFPDPAKSLRAKGIEHFLYAVSQGEIGEKTLIEGWSKDNDAVMLSSNLGSGIPNGDCSGIINRGTVLDAKKYHLVTSDFPQENILVATVPV